MNLVAIPRSKHYGLFEESGVNATWGHQQGEDRKNTVSIHLLLRVSAAVGGVREQQYVGPLKGLADISNKRQNDVVKNTTTPPATNVDVTEFDNNKNVGCPANIRKNPFVENEKTQKLLAMLRSDKFVGVIDPVYHARYISSREETEQYEMKGMREDKLLGEIDRSKSFSESRTPHFKEGRKNFATYNSCQGKIA